MTRFYVTNTTILGAIQAMNSRMIQGFSAQDKRMTSLMSEFQTDIDNAVATVTDLLNDVSTDQATILSDIDAIKTELANGTPVSTTALNDLMAKVKGVKDGLDSATQNLSSVATPPATT